MKAIKAAFVAVFILWVVDANFNGSQYTIAITDALRTMVKSFGIRI